MKAIEWHIQAVKIIYNSLKTHRFWLYFTPGLLVLFLFLISTTLVSSLFSLPNTESTNKIGHIIFKSWNTIGSVFQFILNQVFVFVVITLLSPFNTLLSEKLDASLTNQKFTFSLSRIVHDFMRMLGIVTLALVLELILFFCWWIIAKIFGFTDSFPYKIVSFAISAFFFGFSFYDHSLERYHISIRGSLSFAVKNWGIVLITGMCFNILYYFPYLWTTPSIGIIVAPVLTTMISTVVYLFYLGKLKPNSKN